MDDALVCALDCLNKHLDQGLDPRDVAFQHRFASRLREVHILACGKSPAPPSLADGGRSAAASVLRVRGCLVWLVQHHLVPRCDVLNAADRACLVDVLGTPEAPEPGLQVALVRPTEHYLDQVARCLAHAYTLPGLRMQRYEDAGVHDDVPDMEDGHAFAALLASSARRIVRLAVRKQKVVDVALLRDGRVCLFQTHVHFRKPIPHLMPSTPPVKRRRVA